MGSINDRASTAANPQTHNQANHRPVGETFHERVPIQPVRVDTIEPMPVEATQVRAAQPAPQSAPLEAPAAKVSKRVRLKRAAKVVAKDIGMRGALATRAVGKAINTGSFTVISLATAVPLAAAYGLQKLVSPDHQEARGVAEVTFVLVAMSATGAYRDARRLFSADPHKIRMEGRDFTDKCMDLGKAHFRGLRGQAKAGVDVHAYGRDARTLTSLKNVLRNMPPNVDFNRTHHEFCAFLNDDTRMSAKMLQGEPGKRLIDLARQAYFGPPDTPEGNALREQMAGDEAAYKYIAYPRLTGGNYFCSDDIKLSTRQVYMSLVHFASTFAPHEKESYLRLLAEHMADAIEHDKPVCPPGMVQQGVLAMQGFTPLVRIDVELQKPPVATFVTDGARDIAGVTTQGEKRFPTFTHWADEMYTLAKQHYEGAELETVEADIKAFAELQDEVWTHTPAAPQG